MSQIILVTIKSIVSADMKKWETEPSKHRRRDGIKTLL
jgi:hypothetical protein